MTVVDAPIQAAHPVADAGVLDLEKVGENSKKRRMPGVDQPSAWSKALVKAYTRYLCREHKASSAQLIRYTRRTVVKPSNFSQSVSTSSGSSCLNIGVPGYGVRILNCANVEPRSAA